MWYYLTPECICYFYLRKSELGGFYDPAMGCYLKEVYTEKDQYPKDKRHLFYPLEFLVDRELIRNAFDLEYEGFVNDEREQLIADLLNNHIVPFITELSTKDGIKQAMHKTRS